MRAAAFALPSWAEGAPLAALEAGSLGVPLVLSSQSSEREYFGGFGYYCDPWSIGSIADAVERALKESDAEPRRQRATFVQSSFNYRKVASSLQEVYRAAWGKSLYDSKAS